MDPQQAADQIGELSQALLDPVDEAVSLADLQPRRSPTASSTTLANSASSSVPASSPSAPARGDGPKSTGLRSSSTSASALITMTFAWTPRPENSDRPKWTELKNLGVDDDEFCRREFVASVKITKAKVL